MEEVQNFFASSYDENHLISSPQCQKEKKKTTNKNEITKLCSVINVVKSSEYRANILLLINTNYEKDF